VSRTSFVSSSLFVTTIVALAVAPGCSVKASNGGSTTTPGATFGFPVDVPVVVDNGGVKLKTPKIVTITYPGDPNAATIEAFTDKLVTSAYWGETLSEYGIAKGTVAHVHAQDAAPATYATDTLEQYVQAQVAATATNGWAAYEPNTLYVIVLPASTTLSPAGCYHSETAVGSNAHVPYVVIDPHDNANRPAGDALTENSVHEIIEGITNPHVLSDTALVNFDTPHLAWNVMFADAEIGDICETTADATFKGPADLPYPLQRMWSNAAAHGDHNPCVPAPPEPFYSTTPIALETISVFVDTAMTASSGLGYRVPLGTTKTIKLGYYADSTMTAGWTITAAEGSYFSPASNQRLNLKLNKGTGKSGDTDTLDITANSMAPGAGNAVLVTITSQAPGLPPHSTPILVGTY
jgi:hypothetical protein